MPNFMNMGSLLEDIDSVYYIVSGKSFAKLGLLYICIRFFRRYSLNVVKYIIVITYYKSYQYKVIK